MEGDNAEDARGPGKKGEPPVSAIVPMAEEAMERERRRGPRKMDNRIKGVLGRWKMN